MVLALAAGRNCVVAAYIPVGKTGGRLLRVDARTQETVEFGATLRQGTRLAVDPDGDLCAFIRRSDSANPQLWVVSLRDGKRLWKCHTAGMGSVAFSSDGLSLAHVQGDRLVLWRNVREPRFLGGDVLPPRVISWPLPGHATTLAFGEDDDRIAVSGPRWSGILDAGTGSVTTEVAWRNCIGAHLIDDVVVSYGSGADPPSPSERPPGSSRRQKLAVFFTDLADAARADRGVVLNVRPALSSTTS